MRHETNSNSLIIENTENGYLSKMILKGKTLVSLFSKKSIRLMKNNTMELNANLFSSEEKYSFMMNQIDSSFVGGYGCLVIVYYPTLPTDYIAFGGSSIESLKNQYFCQRVTIKSENPTRVAIALHSNNDTSSFAQLKDVFVLEGDHAQNPAEYLEGLKSVGDGIENIEIISSGENLFNFDKMWGKTPTITYEILDNNNINVSKLNGNIYDYVGYEFKLTPNARYEIGATVSNNLNTKCGIGIKNSSNAGSYPDILPNIPKREFIVPSDGIIRLNFYPTLGTTDNATMIARDIFIRRIENKNNPYISTKQDKKLLLFKDKDGVWKKPIIRGVDENNCDIIEELEDGKVRYRKRYGEVTLNGSENGWSSDSSRWNETTIKPLVSNAILDAKVDGNNINILCDSFKPFNIYDVSNVIEGVYYSVGLNIHIRISKSRLSTVSLEGFKTWLKSNKITIVYELAQEEVYECTPIASASFKEETTWSIESGAISPNSTFETNYTLNNAVNRVKDVKVFNGAMADNLIYEVNNIVNIL